MANTKGHSLNSGEWQTVHRRENITGNQNDRKNSDRQKVVSFFVGNIPEGYGVQELKESFKDYGNLVDVYMARKKDKAGHNFGFVRYAGVYDTMKMEGSLGKVHMGNSILTVNLSRYQRKSNFNGSETKKTFIPKYSSNHNAAPASAWGLSGGKSYANVVSNGNNIASVKNPIVVKLCPSQELDKLLSETFLIGEVHDLEILKAIPVLLKESGINFGRVFFYGGLNVLIGFDEKDEAVGLYENMDCWSKWFKWLKMGNEVMDLKYQRAANVEIVGLPIQLRTSDNLSKILNVVGKVLMVDSDIWKNDMSSCFGCILTDSLTRINVEVLIDYGNEKKISIGIIEKDFYLKPFSDDVNCGAGHLHDSKDMDCKNSLDDNPDESDGITDSLEDDWEEGEVRPEEKEVNCENHSPMKNIPFPIDVVSEVADNALNIPDDDDVVIEESLGDDVNPNVSINPPVRIPWGPMYTDGLCFSFGLTSKFKKRRKFSPTRRSQTGDFA